MAHEGDSFEAVAVMHCNVCKQACTRHMLRLDAIVERHSTLVDSSQAILMASDLK